MTSKYTNKVDKNNKNRFLEVINGYMKVITIFGSSRWCLRVLFEMVIDLLEFVTKRFKCLEIKIYKLDLNKDFSVSYFLLTY